MSKLTNRKVGSSPGFTIIEILIVLAIVALIILIVFLAVPALQRNTRNNGRSRDASLLLTAVITCLSDNANDETYCSQPSHINLSARDLSVYTGFHYGVVLPGNDRASQHCGTVYDNSPDVVGGECPPSDSEPNWIFNLSCLPGGTGYGPGGIRGDVYVGEVFETGSGLPRYHCIGNEY